MQYAVGPAWLQEDRFNADSFAALAEIGLAELKKLGSGLGIVCGPISTGGLGDAEKNFEVFNAAIWSLQRKGHKLFVQIPYEGSLGRLRQRWEADNPENTGYCMPILTEFYGPLFKSGLIDFSWFIPGWQSSFGATWERNELQELGVGIVDLTPDWIQGALCHYRTR